MKIKADDYGSFEIILEQEETIVIKQDDKKLPFFQKVENRLEICFNDSN